MKAFHGDLKIKEKYLDRLRAHQSADELIKGKYWENGKGCAVGCTVHSSNHMKYENELGIPVMLARLEDGIFENLENGKSKEWPIRFLSAISVGADLSMVGAKFMYWLLVDPKDGVIRFAKKGKTKESIQKVADLYQRKINGDYPSKEEWRSAADAYATAATADAYACATAATAAAAAADAAYAYATAATAAAADAAYAYAYDAYAAAADAAYAYDAAAAADSAEKRKFHYEKMANKLIELLEESRPLVLVGSQ